RFPMEKYDLLPEQLVYEGTLEAYHFYEPGLLTEAQVLTTHSPGYWEKLCQGTLSPREIRRTGFPYSPRLLTRGLSIARGTLENARYALAHRSIGLNIAGGTHHAFADRGEGFCLLNDIALAANILLAEGTVRQILIVDLDVHQGNGTAAIFRHDTRVFTFSIHGAHNYPLHKEQSDLDLPLPDGTGDQVYLEQLKKNLPPLLDQVQPDLVFYLAGVDVLASDRLGRLALSPQGVREREAFVLGLCHRHRLPVAVSLGGGYSPQVRDIIEAHAHVFRLARLLWDQ
ncbi:MAG: histone deacetylase, partial [Bacteroidetes bacterium]